MALATYNRYLYRPPGMEADLEEIAVAPSSVSPDSLTVHAITERCRL